MDLLCDFNKFVKELVRYQISGIEELTHEDISEQINVSHSFFRQAISLSSSKHFNLKHIFNISQAIEISIDKLVPSIENFKLLRSREPTQKEWMALTNNAKNKEDFSV